MKKIWAPWRMTYISAIETRDNGCVFCTKPKKKNDRKSLILYRGKKCFVIMNLFPYNNGHLMVVPYEHVSDICALDRECSDEVWDAVCRCRKALAAAFRPDGYNIGMNLGRSAGAGIDRHLHVHVVPRWNGDTNFMPVLDDTKVISQALEETYDLLLPLFRSSGDTASGAAAVR